MNVVVGVDMGGTNLRVGTVAKSGAISNFEKIPIASVMQPDIVLGLERKIAQYVEHYSLQDKMCAVSVGVPSSVSKDKSFIYSTPNLPGLNNIDLGHILQEKIKAPVFIDRDVNYLLNNDIDEYKLDASKNKTIIGIYVGTGIGNAMYINGRFYTGKNGVAGELGHIPLLGSDTRCGCGNIGCSETRASGRYLETLCTEHFPDCAIRDIFVKNAEHPLVQDFLKTLAYVIDTEINIIDPDYVVLAGGVLAMAAFPRDTLLSYMRQHIRAPYPLDNIKFVFPEHTQESGVRGGALLAFEKIGK